jgi:phosphohistidine swiveling domain-containing protein
LTPAATTEPATTATLMSGRDDAGGGGWHDPLNNESDPGVHWTRANIDEIFPSAITHLTWSLVGEAGELGWRESFYDAGILPKSRLRLPDDPSDRAWSAFFGRPAFNYDYLKYFAFAAFSSTDDAAAAVLNAESRAWRARRYAKTAWSVALLPRALRRLRARTDEWWRPTVDPACWADPDRAALGLEEARRIYEAVSRLHVLNSVVPVAWAYAETARMTEQAGMPQVASTLLGGFPSLEEVRLAQALWEVGRQKRTLEAFCADFGFHGPVESELASRSWREDPAPLRALLANLEQTGDSNEPIVAEHRRRDEHRSAQQALRRALPPVAAARAMVVLALGRRYVPLRQVGKASLVQCLDVARACARSLGGELYRRGCLADPDDVCMLTVDEVLAAVRNPSTGSLAPLTAWRRERHALYLTLEVPRDFYGVPEPLRQADAGIVPNGAVTLHGQGVSAGVVEGPARVLGSATDSVEPGDILVCPFTDPGWTPLLVVVAGVVLDVGGSMSHGAIIARELGIPCVLGTGNGTATIRTGDRLRVDGGNGIVEILERSA